LFAPAKHAVSASGSGTGTAGSVTSGADKDREYSS